MRFSIPKWVCVSLLVLGLSVGGSLAFAEDENSNPGGWSKGEK